MACSGDGRRQPLEPSLRRVPGRDKELGGTVCSSSAGRKGQEMPVAAGSTGGNVQRRRRARQDDDDVRTRTGQ
jgi:hypothetical protein